MEHSMAKRLFAIIEQSAMRGQYLESEFKGGCQEGFYCNESFIGSTTEHKN
jgi:hypothetical protein